LAILFALLSSLCFGIAHVTARVGLRTLDARAGAAISVPTAALLFIAAAPFALDLSQFSATAAILFAVVGLFFPAVVTLLIPFVLLSALALASAGLLVKGGH